MSLDWAATEVLDEFKMSIMAAYIVVRKEPSFSCCLAQVSVQQAKFSP